MLRGSFSLRVTNIDDSSFFSGSVVTIDDFSKFVEPTELASFFEGEKEEARAQKTCFVYMCENLSFAIYALSDFINDNLDRCRVVANGEHSPKCVQFLGENGVLLSFLDFTSLCDESTDGFTYDRETYFSDNDFDVLGRLNVFMLQRVKKKLADCNVNEERLGIGIMTRTSFVREFIRDDVRPLKSSVNPLSVGGYASAQAMRERPKTDDELFCYNACTRGGFSFVASEHAGKPYDGAFVISFDAISQYPAHICAHLYPERFQEASFGLLSVAFEHVRRTSLETLLDRFANPFPCAFDALFSFEGIRLKSGSVFEMEGIGLLQWSRFNDSIFVDTIGDMEFTTVFTNKLRACGYKDQAEGAEHRLGKLISADKCEVWLTDLEAWCLCQVYDFDSVKPVHGFATTHFCRPTDEAVISSLSLYERKKDAKGTGLYESAKKDLNSVYGIFATNEARPSCLISESGITLDDSFGVSNLPARPKAWYQMGQRVSGWGRVAQVVNILLVKDVCLGVVYGDTDSLKLLVKEEKEVNEIEERMTAYDKALRKAMGFTLSRVERCYEVFTERAKRELGRYRLEYVTRRFYAANVKQYIYEKECGELEAKVSGLRTKIEGYDHSYSDLVNEIAKRHSFADTCKLAMGLNVKIGNEIANGYEVEFPEFGAKIDGYIQAPFVKSVGFTVGSTRGETEDGSNESAFMSWEPGRRPVIERIDDVFGAIETEIL